MRIVISAAVIRNGKLLLCRKKQAWLLPGGKPEKGDADDRDCLAREVLEELGVELGSSSLFTTVQGKSPHKGDTIKMRVYLAEIVGEPQPKAEILEVAWVGPEGIDGMPEATIQAFQEINEEGRLF